MIQCAAKKNPQAGYLRADDGRRILFVADPETAPANAGIVFARPDNITDQGLSWRQTLVNYNEAPSDNPLGLLPAWQLYENSTYEMLVKNYGRDRIYILSAGWGLISAGFLTPVYDITFSASAEKYKRRRRSDDYDDLNMLASTISEPVVFLGGKDYIGLFCRLTINVKGPRTVFYNSSSPPSAPGCALERFVTTTRTNWHYGCAKALVAETVRV